MKRKIKQLVISIFVFLIGISIVSNGIKAALTSENYSHTSPIPSSWNGVYATVKNHRYKYENGKIYLKVVWGTNSAYTDGEYRGYDFFWLKNVSGTTIWSYDSRRASMTSSSNNFSYRGSTFYYKEGDWVQISGAAPNKPTVSFSGTGTSKTANLSATANNTPVYYYDYSWSSGPHGTGDVQFDPITSSTAALPDYVVAYYYTIDTSPSTTVTKSHTKITTESINVGSYKNASTTYYLHVAAMSYTGLLSSTTHIAIPTNYAYLDLAGMLDGASSSTLGSYGTVDVYVNGTLVANDVNDFYEQYPIGSSYSISDIKAATGKTYNGVYSGSTSGTISSGGNTTRLSFSTNSYTVAFRGNGNTGGSTPNQTFKYGTGQNLNANGYTKTGYTFSKWTTNANGTGTSYTDKQYVNNLTTTNGGTIYLYAQWTPNKYTVKFNGNGSTSGSTADQSFTYDVAQKLNKNGYSRAGYTFNGWNTKADGTGTSYTDQQSVINLTSTNNGTVYLYAQWKVIPPELDTKKSYYYKDSVITVSEIIQDNASASDVVEGNITDKIVITKFTYLDGTVVNNPKTLDTSKLGEVTVEYSVTNERGATVTQTNIVTIVERGSSTDSQSNQPLIYSRFISDEELWDGTNAIDSLHTSSIWRTQDYSSQLKDAIDNTTPLAGYDFINDPTFKANARR